MSRVILAAVVGGAVGIAIAAAPAAKSTLPHYMKNTAEMEFKPGPSALPPGVQMSMLEGDPSKEGFFAMRAKMPKGYVIPPHYHPKEERLTIIEGTFELGMSDKVDESKYERFSAGAYIAMPPGMPHFARAKTDVVLQLATNGPWEIIYLNPADDPRRKKSER